MKYGERVLVLSGNDNDPLWVEARVMDCSLNERGIKGFLRRNLALRLKIKITDERSVDCGRMKLVGVGRMRYQKIKPKE